MSEVGGMIGIILAHGSLAHGLADAVRSISGVSNDVLLPLSNSGMSPAALEAELSTCLEQGPAVVFTDLPSGSCSMAAHKCCRLNPAQTVISGVNLPILLDFVFNRTLPLEELVPRLLERGSQSIRCTKEPIAHADPPVSG